MSRLLLAVLALSALGYLAYRQMYANRPPQTVEAPTDRLQNVREAAKRMEHDQDKRGDEAQKAAAEQ